MSLLDQFIIRSSITMSRYASSGRHNHGNVALAICSSFLGKEAQYRKGAATNHTLAKMAAGRLVPGNGQLESALMSLLPTTSTGENEEEDKAKVQEFLAGERGKINDLSLLTVEAELETDAFLESIKTFRDKILAQEDEQSSSNNDDIYTNVEKILTEEMDRALTERKASNPPESHEKYQQICEELGIEVARAKKKNDEDDEIEVVRNNTGTAGGVTSQGTSAQAVPKCPITSMDMEDPVRNKICGHVYSRAGIEHMMRGKGFCKCPIAGCNNYKVTPDQLEKDLEMELLVKRAQVRKRKAEQTLSQSAELVDSDEE